IIQENMKNQDLGTNSYSLEVLEGIDPRLFLANLPRILQMHVEAQTYKSIADFFQRSLKQAKNSTQVHQINSAAFSAIIAQTNPDHSHATIELNSKTLKLRSEVILGLFKSDDPSDIALATQELHRLANSSSPKK
ncbi:MAG: hypothetical protein ACXU9U_05705, partial [Parachlamydiaceae bacterium]